MEDRSQIIYREESYRILGACFAVYNEKGCGFLESVYHECLEIEFENVGIPYCSKPALFLEYRGRRLQQTFQPDFVCFDKILLEIKATAGLADEHRAQVLNYLSASGLQLGNLVNFGHHPKVQHERFIRGDKLRPIAEQAAASTEGLHL